LLVAERHPDYHVLSDPLVFTQLLQEIGVRGLQVDDLYSLDPETLESLQPIHALIFLFKWVAPTETSDAEKKQENDEASKKVGGQLVSLEESQDCGVYFANQVINNACATIATVNAVSLVGTAGIAEG
jgi:ubiquitin carboxyl-terminal hydrolase L5